MKDVFTLATSAEIAETLRLIPDEVGGYVSYTLTDNDDLWQTVFVAHNGGDTSTTITLPEGDWEIIMTTDDIGEVQSVEYNGSTVMTLSSLGQLEGETNLTLNKNDTYVLIKYADNYLKTGLSTGAIVAIASGTFATISIAVLLFIFRKKIFKI